MQTRRSSRRLTAVSAALLLLSGCVNYLRQREAYLSQFVGRGEAELVQALGVPSRTYETGGAKFLAYDERRAYYSPGPPPPYYGWGWGWGWYAGYPPVFVERQCETTFEVTGGIVQRFTLRGDGCSSP
jgi:hypothetical protein